MADKPILYSWVVAFSNLLDRAMFYKVSYCLLKESFSSRDKFTLQSVNEKTGDELEVQFKGSTVWFFDLKTLGT